MVLKNKYLDKAYLNLIKTNPNIEGLKTRFFYYISISNFEKIFRFEQIFIFRLRQISTFGQNFNYFIFFLSYIFIFIIIDLIFFNCIY